MFADFRYALRTLWAHPGATSLIVMIMAIAIGANTTVFTIVNGVFLEPVPFADADGIVTIENEIPPNMTNVRSLLALREESRNMPSIGGVMPGRQPQVVEAGDAVSQQHVARASANFLGDVLGVQPQLGRAFVPADERPGAPPVALINDAFWKSRFGGAPDVIGRTVRLWNIPPVEIVGVLPPDFRSPVTLEEPEAIWMPLGDGGVSSVPLPITIFARLGPGTTIDEARAELAVIQGAVASASGERMVGRTFRMDPVASLYSSGSERTTILVFFAAVLAVLLIGVANVAGFELACLPRFEGSMAVRSAIGATRGQLVRFMLTRSVALGLCGGLLGTAMAVTLTRIVLANTPLPRRLDLQPDVRVLAFSIGLSLAAAVLIGLLPALGASRPNVQRTRHGSSRGFVSDRKYRVFQDALIAVQTGTALVLTFSAGLLVHNLRQISDVDMGFDRDVVVVQVATPPAYEGAEFAALFADILERLGSVDNVESAAVSTHLPMFLSTGAAVSTVDAEGNRRELASVSRQRNAVSPDYFETMGIPLLSGRTFTPEEDRDALPVAVISESVVRDLFPGENPVGRLLTWDRGGEAVDLTVIGVAGNYRSSEINERRSATLYLPSGMMLPNQVSGLRPASAFVVARTPASPQTVGQIVGSVEPTARIQTTTITEHIAARNAGERFRTWLHAAFAGIAFPLAGVGVYTVLSHLVGRRTPEFGVRMALGASRRHVFEQVFRRVLPQVAIGMLIGLGVAYALRNSFAAYTFVVATNDVRTYAAACAFILVVILAACAGPALRASRLNPTAALRHE